MRVVSDKRRDAEEMRQGEAVKTGEVKGNSLDVRGQFWGRVYEQQQPISITCWNYLSSGP